MSFDIGKSKQNYLGGVRGFGHRRMAKQMVDAKRKAKIGDMGDHPEPDADDAGGPSDMDADNGAMGGAMGAEGAAPDSAQMAAPGTEGAEGAEGGATMIEVSPEELAIIEQLRAARG